jgi:hypothetical protein
MRFTNFNELPKGASGLTSGKPGDHMVDLDKVKIFGNRAQRRWAERYKQDTKKNKG